MLSEEAFLKAVLSNRVQLYRSARAILWNDDDAADAVQEAMLKAWKRRWQLRDEERIDAWFMRILINQCRDMQRKNMRDRTVLTEYTAIHEDWSRQFDIRILWNMICALPRKLRIAVQLYYYGGYSQKEIAVFLGILAELVKSRIRQAREKIKNGLEGD